MPNRIKQIDREDEVTRVNEYQLIFTYMSRRPWTAEKWSLGHTTRETSSIFVSCIMEQSVIRRKTIVTRAWVRFLMPYLALPRVLNVANRLTLLTKYTISNLETWKRCHLHPSACPSSAYRFPIQLDIFNIVVMSMLFAIPPPCLYSAQLWKLLNSPTRLSISFFPLKLNPRDFSLTLLPIRSRLILIITCLT